MHCSFCEICSKKAKCFVIKHLPLAYYYGHNGFLNVLHFKLNKVLYRKIFMPKPIQVNESFPDNSGNEFILYER